MFPFQLDDISMSDIESPGLSRKSFICATSGSSHAHSSPVRRIALRNCKNICNCSIRCSSVSLNSGNVDKVSKPAYHVVSSFYSVINNSKYLKFTPTNSHSFDSSTSTFRVISHRNIHLKRR